MCNSSCSLQSKLNAVLLLCQLLDIMVSKLAFSMPFVGYFNELIFLCVLFLLGYFALINKTINKDILYLFLLLGYSIFQIVLLNLPFNHIIQGFIYIQFVIYFVYYNNLDGKVKIKTIYYLSKYFKFFVIPVTLVAIVDIINPSLTRNLLSLGAENDRGINGFYLQSLFGSTTGLSQFCLLILFIYYIYNALFTPNKLLNYFQYFLILCLAFFSFSRKEVTLVFAFIFLMFHVKKYGRICIKKIVFPVVGGVIIIIGYIYIFFSSANEVSFSDGYNRFKMADYSAQIIKAKFPFGSGVGTFGSQMSLNYGKIYDEFDVGPEMTGYNGERGPIYDSFLFTFTAEQGIGLLLYIYIVFYIIKKAPFKGIYLFNYIRNFIALSLLIISFFAPVIMNAYGLISFSLIGLISQGSKDHKC